MTNLVIGNNATAVDAAGDEAVRLGYSPGDGQRRPVGRRRPRRSAATWPTWPCAMRDRPGPDCLVSGGEPVVKLVRAGERGLGGRNQQLVLAALERLADDGAEGIALLSGGTDGEDGPTDAAGAVLDAAILAAARARRPRPGRLPRPQRRLPLLRAARRPDQDRPDPHERLRRPRRGRRSRGAPRGRPHQGSREPLPVRILDTHYSEASHSATFRL